jgi:hypothetical protein
MKIKTRIEFVVDTNDLDLDWIEGLTQEQVIDLEIDAFVEDIERLVKYNELREAVRVEIEGAL